MKSEAFYEQIKDLRSPKAIEQLCLELLDTVVPNWREIKAKSVQNKLAPYNKLLRDYPVENLALDENAFIYIRKNGSEWVRHLYFKYTGLTPDQWNEINQPGRDLKVERLQNKAPIPVTPYIDTTRRLLRSSDPHELVVGIIAATGRRKTEILARGEFTLPEQPVDYLHQDYQLTFSGQLKKREPEPPFPIGTLFPAKTVLSAWERYRRTPECKQLLKRIEKLEASGKSEEEINKIISDQRSHSIDRVVKEYFTSFLPPRHGMETDSAHTLRAATVHLITTRDCPKKIEPILFASWQLGHFINHESVDNSKLNRIVTSCGYLNYYVESEVPYPKDLIDNEIELSLKIHPEDLDTFEQLQRELKLPNQAETFHKLIESSQELGETIGELQEELGSKKLEIENLSASKSLMEKEIEQLKLANRELEKKITDYQQITENVTSTEEIEQLRVLNQELDKKVRELQQNPEKTAAPDQELTDLIDSRIRLIVTQEIQHQLNHATPQPVLEPKTPRITSNQKPLKSSRDWSMVSNQELKPSKEKGAADEKVRRAYQSMVNYNDYQAASNEQRWFIGTRSLIDMSGCNYQVVKRWLENYQMAVDDHNNKYGLGTHHNRKHVGEEIRETIELWEPSGI